VSETLCGSRGPIYDKDGNPLHCTRLRGHEPPCGVGKSRTQEWHLIETLRSLHQINRTILYYSGVEGSVLRIAGRFWWPASMQAHPNCGILLTYAEEKTTRRTLHHIYKRIRNKPWPPKTTRALFAKARHR
jgi:hypothetical protein